MGVDVLIPTQRGWKKRGRERGRISKKNISIGITKRIETHYSSRSAAISQNVDFRQQSPMIRVTRTSSTVLYASMLCDTIP
jgi:hypothetical protein